MKAKEYMMQYLELKVSLQDRQKEISEIEKECCSPSAIRYDMSKVQRSTSGDGMLKILEQMDKRRKYLCSETMRISDKMREIRDNVHKVKGSSKRTILILYYIDGVGTLDDVANKIGKDLTRGRVRHLHGEALSDIQKIIDGEKNET